MFQVKVCGITCVEDAVAAAAAGADAIGLNFFARSPRYVDLETAEKIVAAIPAGVVKVGVFVDAPVGLVQSTVASLGLDMVQFHGEEGVEELVVLKGTPVIKAFRFGGSVDPIVAWLNGAARQGGLPAMVLVDAALAGSYGGTGTQADWQALAAQRHRLIGTRLVLAGGLKAENVAEGISTVRPEAVDVASGVESAPGRKSVELMTRFVAAARVALRLATERSPN